MKNFMFVLMLAALCVGVSAMAVAQSTTMKFLAAVTTTPITLAVTDFDLSAASLVHGHCYNVPADLSNQIAYDLSGGPPQVSIVGELSITGDPNADVVVRFTLPPQLLPQLTGPGRIQCSYGDLNAAWGPVGSENIFFNPQTDNPKALLLDGGGSLGITLTANLCVDATAQADTYEGDALIVVQYAGTTP